MNSFVIDASTLVKLFFPEEHSAEAIQYVKNAKLIIAPDLLWIEATSVVVKRLRKDEISADDATGVIGAMLHAPVDTHGSFNLVRSAFAIAAETRRSVYDCMYLALAVREGLVVVSADERLVNALSGGPYASRIKFVGG